MQLPMMESPLVSRPRSTLEEACLPSPEAALSLSFRVRLSVAGAIAISFPALLGCTFPLTKKAIQIGYHCEQSALACTHVYRQGSTVLLEFCLSATSDLTERVGWAEVRFEPPYGRDYHLRLRYGKVPEHRRKMEVEILPNPRHGSDAEGFVRAPGALVAYRTFRGEYSGFYPFDWSHTRTHYTWWSYPVRCLAVPPAVAVDIATQPLRTLGEVFLMSRGWSG